MLTVIEGQTGTNVFNRLGEWIPFLHENVPANLLNPDTLTQLQATAFEVGHKARYANQTDQQHSYQN